MAAGKHRRHYGVLEEGMKMRGTLLLSGLLLAATAGFTPAQEKPGQAVRPKLAAPHEAQASVSGTSAKPASDYPIIGYLEKRGQTISIKAGPKGALYSAKTSGGKTLFENLSAEQLRAKAPELHEFIKTAVAGGASKRGVVIDASLRHTTTSPFLLHELDARSRR